MRPFEQILEIAQEQAAAVERGDLLSATGRLEERGRLLQAALPALPVDVDVIREILRLDRIFSFAIRERMVAIRDEAMEGQRGRRALDGYGGHRPPAPSRMFDAVG